MQTTKLCKIRKMRVLSLGYLPKERMLNLISFQIGEISDFGLKVVDRDYILVWLCQQHHYKEINEYISKSTTFTLKQAQEIEQESETSMRRIMSGSK